MCENSQLNRTLIEARTAVAKAKADFMTAKAATEAADVEAKTLRLEADGLIKPAPTAVEPWLSELSELSDKLSDCRTLSDLCRTPLSDRLSDDCRNLSDCRTAVRLHAGVRPPIRHLSRHCRTPIRHFRTVGLSDCRNCQNCQTCRTVGLSDCCRTVGMPRQIQLTRRGHCQTFGNPNSDPDPDTQ